MFALSRRARPRPTTAWVWACHGPDGGPIGTHDARAGSEPRSAHELASVDSRGSRVASAASQRPGELTPAARRGADRGRPRQPRAHADAASTLPTTASRRGSSRSTPHRGRRRAPRATPSRHATSLGEPPSTARGRRSLDRAARCASTAAHGPTTPGQRLRDPQRQLELHAGADVRRAGLGRRRQGRRARRRLDRSPYGGVNRSSPVDAVLDADRQRDRAAASASAAPRRSSTAPTTPRPSQRRPSPIGTCSDLTPGDATIDLPLDAARCLTDSQPPTLDVDTPTLPEGTYYRRVARLRRGRQRRDRSTVVRAVRDLATRSSARRRRRSASARAARRRRAAAERRTPTRAASPARPGRGLPLAAPVGLARRRSRCASPRASPVLQYGKRYRFDGPPDLRRQRQAQSRRRSARRSSILNKVGKKTVTSPARRIARQGPLHDHR